MAYAKRKLWLSWLLSSFPHCMSGIQVDLLLAHTIVFLSMTLTERMFDVLHTRATQP